MNESPEDRIIESAPIKSDPLARKAPRASRFDLVGSRPVDSSATVAWGSFLGALGIVIGGAVISIVLCGGRLARLDAKGRQEVGGIQGITTFAGLAVPTPFPSLNSLAKRFEESAGKRKAPEIFPGPQLIARPNHAKIPPGTLVLAGLVSGASNGPVKAALAEPVTVNGETVVEMGSILWGRGASTDERLFVSFTKIIHRDGSTEEIAAQAADFSDKIAGLKGSRVGRRALQLAGGVGLNFIAGLGEALQDSTVTPLGVPVRRPTIKNALLNGSARASLEQGQTMMTNLKNARPIIEVPAGTQIYVLFDDGQK